MSDIIKPFDYRKGKTNGGREALRQVGYLMRQIEEENDYETYEECWKELEQKIADSLSKQVSEKGEAKDE